MTNDDMIQEKTRLNSLISKSMESRFQEDPDNLSFWYDANFNPFGKRIGDCMIRAISAAIMMRYECVCSHLGYGFKDGRGLEQDASTLKQLQQSKLIKYFEPLQLINDETTLYDFVLQTTYNDPGLYVVFGFPTRYATVGHAIYVCAGVDDDSFFIDTFDSGEYIVTVAFKVKYQVGKNNPERLRYRQFKQIQEFYQKEKELGTDVDQFIDDMIDDQMLEWLKADSKDEMAATMRKIQAQRDGLEPAIKNSLKKSLPERIMLASNIFNGRMGCNEYSMKDCYWFDTAMFYIDKLLIFLNTKRDIRNTLEWNDLKNKAFSVMKDLELYSNVKSVRYEQEESVGIVEFEFNV